MAKMTEMMIRIGKLNRRILFILQTPFFRLKPAMTYDLREYAPAGDKAVCGTNRGFVGGEPL